MYLSISTYVYVNIWVFLIHAIIIFDVLRYAITIHLFRNLPLQFSHSLNRAILYVFDAFGPTRRPVYFCMVQNTPWCFSPSLTGVWGPHISFSFNLWCFFFLLPPTPGLVAHPHRNPSRRPAAHGGGGGAARVHVLREDGVAAGVMRRRPARLSARGLQGSRRQQCSGPRPRVPAACRARGDDGGGAEDAEEEDDEVVGRVAGEDPR